MGRNPKPPADLYQVVSTSGIKLFDGRRHECETYIDNNKLEVHLVREEVATIIVSNSPTLDLLKEMKGKYRNYRWSLDSTEQIGFTNDDMALLIVNPFAGSPPWVEVDPVAEYGISVIDAEKLRVHNSQSPDWAW